MRLRDEDDRFAELRYEFIKSKQKELGGVFELCGFGLTQWDLHLFFMGCLCSLFLLNVISRNSILAYFYFFLFLNLLKLRMVKDSFTQYSTLFLTFLSSVIMVVYVCVRRFRNTAGKVNMVLVLLTLIGLNAHLFSWVLLDRSLIGKYNCVSDFLFEFRLMNANELLALLAGCLFMVSIVFFVVNLYSVSYILFIIIIFTLLSRWRFTLLFNREFRTVLDRVRNSRLSRKKRRANEINFFPIVQSLITFFIILIILLILVSTLCNNNLLSLKNQLQLNNYLNRNYLDKGPILVKVKLLCGLAFFLLFLLFLLFGVYNFFFIKRTPLLADLLYNKTVLLISFVTNSSRNYYHLVTQQESQGDESPGGVMVNSKEFKVQLYHLDPWDRVLKVDLLHKSKIKPECYFNNYLNNNKLGSIVRKLSSNSTKFVRKISHKSTSYLFRKINSKDNYLNRKLANSRLFSRLRPVSATGSNDLSNSSSSNVDNYEEDRSVEMGAVASMLDKYDTGLGCNFHNYGDCPYNSDLNLTELYLFMQNYTLYNHGERSIYCLLRHQKPLDLLVYQDQFLLLKSKLLEFSHQFNQLLLTALNSPNFNTTDSSSDDSDDSGSTSSEDEGADDKVDRHVEPTYNEAGPFTTDLACKISIPSEYLSSSARGDDFHVERLAASHAHQDNVLITGLDHQSTLTDGFDGANENRVMSQLGVWVLNEDDLSNKEKRPNGEDPPLLDLGSKRVKHLTEFFNRKFTRQDSVGDDSPTNSFENYHVYEYTDLDHLNGNSSSTKGATTGFFNQGTPGLLNGTVITTSYVTTNNTYGPTNTTGYGGTTAYHGTMTNTVHDTATNTLNTGGFGHGNDRTLTSTRTNNDIGDAVVQDGTGNKATHADASPKKSCKLVKKFNDYEYEYVTMSSNKSFSRLLSQKMDERRKAPGAKIKKLKLDNNFKNNYVYNKTIKLNTVNKYVIQNDSTGTNLISKKSQNNTCASDDGDKVAAKVEREQEASVPKPVTAHELPTSTNAAKEGVDEGVLNPDYSDDDEEAEEENQESKVTSIMNELMKGLNFDI